MPLGSRLCRKRSALFHVKYWQAGPPSDTSPAKLAEPATPRCPPHPTYEGKKEGQIALS